MLRQGIQAGRLLSVIGRSRIVYPTSNLLRVSQAAVTFRHNYSTEPKSTPFVTAPKIQFPQAYSRSFSVTSSYYNEKSDKEEVQTVQTESLKDGEDISNVLESKHEVQALETESVVGQPESHDFQAETRKILDIVARSLYTDREVFLRELISNASDALEKLRHRTIQGQDIIDSYLQPEIHLIADEKAKTITIQDFGIGMSKEELIQNLGTIARSGTSEFVKNLADSPQKESLIGQFGVGFYSTFMVGDQVKVYSRSAVPGSKGYCWISDGSGKYSVAEAEGVQRGTKITIYLKDDAVDFCKEKNIKSVIEKYSNFVNFNITLNGKEVNKIKAIWTMPKGEVTEEMHKEFYQFIANAYDHPLYTLHFTSDTPLNMSALFYAPESHMEKFGMGRMEPGVSLFCRRVLIQHKMKGLLPEYLRFIKGVVDCEDIPLNLSREHLQDSALIKRVGTVLTRRVLKFLGTESKKDEVKYSKFFSEYGTFLKEGIVTDIENKEAIAALLRMDSSSMAGTDTSLTSLDDYIARMKPEQKDIYYLVTAKRDFALTSPYYEGFKRKGVEVLFLYSALDDFVMNNLAAYKGRTLSPIESADIDSLTDEKKEEEKKEETADTQLSESQLKDLQQWIKDVLNERVSSVKASHRLHDSPAIVIDNESASFRRMMKFADPLRAPTIPKQAMEINSKHPIMVKLSAIKDDNPDVAKRVIEQVFDNALIAAGLMEDSRAMLPRLNAILEAALKK